jgi:hypothetical protein
MFIAPPNLIASRFIRSDMLVSQHLNIALLPERF